MTFWAWVVFLLATAYTIGDGLRRTAGAKTMEGFFAAGRSIPWWAAGLSVMATQLSAITLIGGNRVVMSQGEMLLHLYHPTAYHRGFAGDMMFNVKGHRAPVTDLPVFLREVPQSY